jgi:hypothetical protein
VCEPVTIGLAISAAAQVASYVAQSQQASIAEKQYDKLVARVTEGASDEMTQARVRQVQEREAVVADVIAAEQRAQSAISSARVASAEAGVVGASAQAYLQSFARTEVANRFRGERQLAAIDAGAEQQDRAYRRNVREQLMGSQPDVFAPSPVDLGLGLAGTGVQGYMDIKAANNPEKT